MSGVNDVEAAIGKNHPLTLATGVGYRLLQLFKRQDTTLRPLVSLHCPAQLRGRDGGRTQFTDDYAGRHLGPRAAHRVESAHLPRYLGIQAIQRGPGEKLDRNSPAAVLEWAGIHAVDGDPDLFSRWLRQGAMVEQAAILTD